MRHGVRHWRIGDWIDAFELVSGPEAGFLHCHATFNIGAMIDGHAHVSVDGTSYDQLPGSVVMLNAYQPHASGWSAPSNTYFVLHVGHRFWDEGVAAEGPAWGFAIPVNQDQLVFHYLLGLRAQLHADADSISAGDIRSLIDLCRLRGHVVARPIDTTDADEATINDLLRLSEAEDADMGSATVSALAEEAGLTRFQFARLCQRTSGMQPRRLRIQLMVARAQRGIRDGLDLASASAMAGFSDQSHMSREFRRTIGMTPKDYQRLSR